MKACVHLWQYLAEFFLEWEIFQTKSCRENQNTQFMFSNFFCKSCRLRDNVEKYGEARESAHDSIIRSAFWISKATHTITICNTYCFSTVTMVTRTRLNVTSYLRCLCSSLFRSQTQFNGATGPPNELHWHYNELTFLIIFSAFGWSKQERDGRRMWHVWDRQEACIQACGKTWRTEPLRDSEVDRRIILKWIFKKHDGKACIGSGSRYGKRDWQL
jgi:hypothetical protein